MSRYADCFSRLHRQKEGAFVPFVVLGDPDMQTSREIIATLIDAGADALELGFAFSDPLADGPTIQNAMHRALLSGVKSADCFDLLKSVREEWSSIPMGLLMYANPIFHRGLDGFYEKCAQVGVDSVLIADVPLEECEPFHQAAHRHAIHTVYICPPQADEQTLSEVAQRSSGYVYLLSRAGVTGAEVKAGRPVAALIERLRALDAAPTLQGFGISYPEQVQQALQGGADGVIVGSAIVHIIEEYRHDKKRMLSHLYEYVYAMKQASRV